MITFNSKNPVVVLANGEFPRSRKLRQLIQQSQFLLCCDGAVEQLLKYKITKKPDLIIGDLDSVPPKVLKKTKAKILKIADQETNDLEKAFRYLRKEKFHSVIVLGWSGLREDHMLGNFSVLLKNARHFDLQAASDYGHIYSFSSRASKKHVKIKTLKNQIVSLFSSSARAVITTKGLVWDLNKKKLKNLWSGTLNQSRGLSVQIQLEHGEIIVYLKQ